MPDPYYTVETLDPDRSIGYLVKRCGIVMTQIAERGFESQSISFTQWIILMSLSQRAHGSPTELSAQVGYDMGALTRVVDNLEREGLVRRERSEHDRRAVEIAITPEGRRVATAGKRVIVDLLNKLVAPYSSTEVEAFISLLQRFLTQMLDFQAQSQATAKSAAAPAGHPSATPSRRNKREPQPDTAALRTLRKFRPATAGAPRKPPRRKPTE